jgi:hypothetical protein
MKNDEELIGKTCTKCGEWKPLEEFYKSKSGKFGRRSCCKKCQAGMFRKYREKNPEKVRERKRKWYEENSEKVREYFRKYREENLEKVRERQRKWCEENSEKVRERKRKYREENSEKEREYFRKYREENPEKGREHTRAYKRRIRQRQVWGFINFTPKPNNNEQK